MEEQADLPTQEAPPLTIGTDLLPSTPQTRLDEATELAVNVFGNRETAIEWLNYPNLATYNKAPVTLFDTKDGFEHVMLLLHRIEYGVLA